MPEVQFIERSVVQVNGVDLDDLILSVGEKSTRPTKPVNTMNKGRVAKGFKQGNNQYSLDIVAERIVDARIPDWHALKDAGAVIKIQVRYNVGPSVTYDGCKITDVSDDTSDGDSNRKISVVARTRK
jgi:hypothetical protein